MQIGSWSKNLQGGSKQIQITLVRICGMPKTLKLYRIYTPYPFIARYRSYTSRCSTLLFLSIVLSDASRLYYQVQRACTLQYTFYTFSCNSRVFPVHVLYFQVQYMFTYSTRLILSGATCLLIVHVLYRMCIYMSCTFR